MKQTVKLNRYIVSIIALCLTAYISNNACWCNVASNQTEKQSDINKQIADNITNEDFWWKTSLYERDSNDRSRITIKNLTKETLDLIKKNIEFVVKNTNTTNIVILSDYYNITEIDALVEKDVSVLGRIGIVDDYISPVYKNNIQDIYKKKDYTIVDLIINKGIQKAIETKNSKLYSKISLCFCFAEYDVYDQCGVHRKERCEYVAKLQPKTIEMISKNVGFVLENIVDNPKDYYILYKKYGITAVKDYIIQGAIQAANSKTEQPKRVFEEYVVMSFLKYCSLTDSVKVFNKMYGENLALLQNALQEKDLQKKENTIKRLEFEIFYNGFFVNYGSACPIIACDESNIVCICDNIVCYDIACKSSEKQDNKGGLYKLINDKHSEISKYRYVKYGIPPKSYGSKIYYVTHDIYGNEYLNNDVFEKDIAKILSAKEDCSIKLAKVIIAMDLMRCEYVSHHTYQTYDGSRMAITEQQLSDIITIAFDSDIGPKTTKALNMMCQNMWCGNDYKLYLAANLDGFVGAVVNHKKLSDAKKAQIIYELLIKFIKLHASYSYQHSDDIRNYYKYFGQDVLKNLKWVSRFIRNDELDYIYNAFMDDKDADGKRKSSDELSKNYPLQKDDHKTRKPDIVSELDEKLRAEAVSCGKTSDKDKDSVLNDVMIKAMKYTCFTNEYEILVGRYNIEDKERYTFRKDWEAWVDDCAGVRFKILTTDLRNECFRDSRTIYANRDQLVKNIDLVVDAIVYAYNNRLHDEIDIYALVRCLYKYGIVEKLIKSDKLQFNAKQLLLMHLLAFGYLYLCHFGYYQDISSECGGELYHPGNIITKDRVTTVCRMIKENKMPEDIICSDGYEQAKITILYAVAKCIKDAIGYMRIRQVSELLRYNDIFVSELGIDLYDAFIACVNDKDILLYYCDLIEAQYMGWDWHKLLHKIRDNVDLNDKDRVCDTLRTRVEKKFGLV